VVVGRPLQEHELVERARSGDAGAYAALVRGHQEIAFRTAYLITGNAADAEDAAQEGFVKAYRALGRFRAGEPLRPWLLTIVANEARNRRRSAGRRAALALRAALLAAMEQLRDDDRLVIACRYFLDLSEAETAAALGVRPGTVKSRLSRSLQRLRAELGDRDD
jgi:DNA-directed RNA polymerase specialized sigma24 family protein